MQAKDRELAQAQQQLRQQVTIILYTFCSMWTHCVGSTLFSAIKIAGANNAHLKSPIGVHIFAKRTPPIKILGTALKVDQYIIIEPSTFTVVRYDMCKYICMHTLKE